MSRNTMRAIVVKDGKGPIENLIMGEIERPSPRQGEVLVKVFTLVSSALMWITSISLRRPL